MKPFSVLVVRESNPKDGTNGHHQQQFSTRKEACEYAEQQTADGAEKATVHQWGAWKGTGIHTIKRFTRE